MLYWILLLLLALAPAWAHAALSFEQALALAAAEAPALTADAARVAALRAEAIPSDALPDPKLIVGVENFPVTGTDRFSFTRDFMTMEKIGIQQTWTPRATRAARRRGAEARIESAAVNTNLTRLKLRRDAALAWLTVANVERKLTAVAALNDENIKISKTISHRYAAGKLDSVAALAPAEEALGLSEQREALEAERALARLELQRVIGAAAALPLDPAMPTFVVDAEHLREHLARHPELEAAASLLEVARAAVAAAEADKHPGWDIEVAYAHRGPDYGDMVSAELSIDLPVFAAKRQDPLISARLHDLASLEAERAQMLRDHTAELERGLIDYGRKQQRLVRYQRERVPLAEKRAAVAVAAYAAGEVALNDVFAARRALIKIRLQLIEADAEVIRSAAMLYYSYEGGEHDALD